MNDALRPEDMKYGLIAVDMREVEKKEKDGAVILHFCGFENPPTQADINQMYETMANTPEFGLADIMEYIGIYDATPEIVEEYRNGIIKGNIQPIQDSTLNNNN